MPLFRYLNPPLFPFNLVFNAEPPTKAKALVFEGDLKPMMRSLAAGTPSMSRLVFGIMFQRSGVRAQD